MPLQSGQFTVIKLASKYILLFVFLAVLVYCFHWIIVQYNLVVGHALKKRTLHTASRIKMVSI